MRTLLFRPFLLVAMALLLGGWCGAQWFSAQENALRFAARTDWIYGGARLLQCLAVLAFLLFCRQARLIGVDKWRRGFTKTCPILLAWAALFFASGLAFYQRALPPINDISHQVQARLQNAAKAPLATLRGQVVAPPRLSEYSQEFVLRLADSSGQAWVKAPRSLPKVRAGMLVEVRATLDELPRARNSGEVSRADFYRRLGCYTLARLDASMSATPPLRVLAPDAGWHRWLNTTRAALAGFYRTRLLSTQHQPYPRATAALLASLAFGEDGLDEPLPHRTQERFREAGLSHLLVASGTQVSLLLLLVLLPLRLLGVRGAWLVACALPPLVVYSALAGGEASIVRAAIGGLCVIVALSAGRRSDSLSLWALALCVLLLLDPLNFQDVGLQLSFAAAWGLIVLTPVLRVLSSRAMNSSDASLTVAQTKMVSWLPMSLAMIFAVQAAVLPVQLTHFGNSTFAAIPANILGIPLATGAVYAAVMALFIPPLVSVAAFFTRALDSWATGAAIVPSSGFTDQKASFLAALFLVFVMVLAALRTAIFRWKLSRADMRIIAAYQVNRWRRDFLRWRNNAPRRFTWWMGAAALLALAWIYLSTQPRRLQVTFLDVGQGDSIVIATPNGKTILIDGGSGDVGRGDVGTSIIVPFLQSQGIKKLDALILTHADADHCNALASVSKEIPIAEIIDGAAEYSESSTRDPSGDYERLRRLWRRQNISVLPARAGQTYQSGDGVILRVLTPQTEMGALSENDRSAVVRLDYGKNSFLFTGDLEKNGERLLMQSGENLRASVLKVAHHGARNGSSPEFLQRVQPQFAAISCGRFNRYGHPTPAVVSRLRALKTEIYRTDRDGEITFSCDRERCNTRTFR